MIQRLQWHRGPDDGPFSPPSSLAPYAGQEISIEVRPHQTALLLRHHEIRAALLPNLHRIRVRPRDDRPETCPTIAVAREVGPDDVLIFLQLGSFPMPLRSPEDEASSGWQGVAQLRLTEPRRFYESFLRHSEDLPPEQFQRICARLLAGIVADHPCAPTTPAAQETLSVRLGVKLRSVGLRLQRIDLRSPEEPEANPPVQPLVTSAGKL